MPRDGTIQSHYRLLPILLSVSIAFSAIVIITSFAMSRSYASDFHLDACGTLSGVIDEDTELFEDCLYDVTGNVLVDSTATLTINPGVIVNFKDANFIQVDGTLKALGTKDKQILFTSDGSDDLNSVWQEIRLLGTEKSVMSYVIFERTGSNGSGGDVPISAFNGPHLLDHITFIAPQFGDSGPDAIVGLGSGQTLQNSLFSKVNGSIIWVIGDSSFERSTKIISNTFSWNGSVLQVENGTVNFSNNRVIHNGFTRISGVVTFTHNSVVHNRDFGASFAAWGSDKLLVECNLFRSNGFSNSSPQNPSAHVYLNLGSGSNIKFHKNNLFQPGGGFSLKVDSAPPSTVTLANNYWGTVNEEQIDASIWDYNDDFFLSAVDYKPFLSEPDPCAPVEPSLVAYLPSIQK